MPKPKHSEPNIVEMTAEEALKGIEENSQFGPYGKRLINEDRRAKQVYMLEETITILYEEIKRQRQEIEHSKRNLDQEDAVREWKEDHNIA